jgi:hypothetical protein
MMASIAALLAPFSSTATRSEASLSLRTFLQKCCDAAASRFAVSRDRGLAFLSDGAGPVDVDVEVLSAALDLDLRCVHPPASADRAFVFAGYFSISGEKRIAYGSIFECPTAALVHQILELVTTQRTSSLMTRMQYGIMLIGRRAPSRLRMPIRGKSRYCNLLDLSRCIP